MHIPKGASQTCALLTFDDALHCTEHDDYDAARWLYVPPYYTEYRYILGTRGENPLICIGINPSTAQPGDLDNTLKSVERIALGNGYDSFTMFNVYPQRATDPNAMDTTFNRALHEQNMAAFRYVLGQYAPGNWPAVWAAWGTLIEKRPYLFDALEQMLAIGEEYHAQWLTFGARSKAGHPHHPLYLRRDSVPGAVSRFGKPEAVVFYSTRTFTGLITRFPPPATVYHLPFSSLIFSDTPDVIYPTTYFSPVSTSVKTTSVSQSPLTFTVPNSGCICSALIMPSSFASAKVCFF